MELGFFVLMTKKIHVALLQLFTIVCYMFVSVRHRKVGTKIIKVQYVDHGGLLAHKSVQQFGLNCFLFDQFVSTCQTFILPIVEVLHRLLKDYLDIKTMQKELLKFVSDDKTNNMNE